MRPSTCLIDDEGRECSSCGRSSSCKPCRNAKSLEYRQSDPEGYNAYRRRVTSKFGLSPEQYAWLSDQQGAVLLRFMDYLEQRPFLTIGEQDFPVRPGVAPHA